MSNPNRRPTAREKIADWTLAYHVMLEEMVGPLRTPPGISDENRGLFRDEIIAVRRTAALAAAILVANAGVERAVVTETWSGLSPEGSDE